MILFLFSSDGLLCSASCHCSDEAFNPVCGSDGVEFRSPCHAGCITTETNSNHKTLVRAEEFVHLEFKNGIHVLTGKTSCNN